MRRLVLTMLGVLLVSSSVWAYRSKRPQAFTDLSDPNQLVELNNVLSDVWSLTNGRYTLENLTTDPQDTRKGQKGDLVYATFGGNEHLCVNTSFPIGMEWTCVNVGALADCPGGADTQVQFNDNGDCGGDAAFIYDKNLNSAALSVSGQAVINQTFDLSLGELGTNNAGFQRINVRDSITTPSASTSYTASLNYLLATQAGAGIDTELYGLVGAIDYNQTAGGINGAAPLVAGLYGIGSSTSTQTNVGNSPDINGVIGYATHRGTGRVDFLQGGYFSASNEGSGTANSMTGIYIASVGNNGGGTVNNTYGLLMENQDIAATNGSFGLYIESDSGEDQRNWIGNSLGIGSGGTADDATNHVLDIDPGDMTGLSTERIFLNSQGSVIGIASGVTLANERVNQFLAPTLNGVAGGATETVTDAATVFIDTHPSGSNITFTNVAADILFGEDGTASNVEAVLRVMDQSTANTAGRGFEFLPGDGNGSGAGGAFTFTAGNGGATGSGGDIVLQGGTAGSSGTAEGGDIFVTTGSGRGSLGGGDLFIQTGNAQGSSNTPGGDIFIQPGSSVGDSGNTIYFEPIGGGPLTTEQIGVSFEGDAFSMDVASGSTIALERAISIEAPRIDGVAGGATETITNAATVYIDAAPSGSNITFTNGPYALWVDAGRTRFDGFVDMFASATVTGILTVDGTVETNNTITSSRSTDLGWTVQNSANQACNTTCTSGACVVGLDTSAVGNFLGCTDATADSCLCAK